MCCASNENVGYDVAVHVGKTDISTAETECESFVVKTELMKHGGVDVLNQ